MYYLYYTYCESIYTKLKKKERTGFRSKIIDQRKGKGKGKGRKSESINSKKICLLEKEKQISRKGYSPKVGKSNIYILIVILFLIRKYILLSSNMY